MTKKQVGFAITPSAHKKLGAYADKAGKSMSEVFTEYVSSLRIELPKSIEPFERFAHSGITPTSLRLMLHIEEELSLKFNRFCRAVGKSRDKVLDEFIQSLPKVKGAREP